MCVCFKCLCALTGGKAVGVSLTGAAWVTESTSSSWLLLSGSVMKLGFSCRIHFLYTLITFRVADASHDGSRKACGGRRQGYGYGSC